MPVQCTQHKMLRDVTLDANTSRKRPIYTYVVVNFLSQVVFSFPLFQLHQRTLPFPKTKLKLPAMKN